MRTIKFRAYDKDKEMILFGIERGYTEQISLSSGGYDEYTRDFSNFLDTNNYEVMQFTGLHDKNGKEIYEGDIITYPILGKDEPIKREVKFYNGAFGVFTGNGTRYPTGGATTEFGLLGNGLVHEVIGNIYENPELLVPTPSK